MLSEVTPRKTGALGRRGMNQLTADEDLDGFMGFFFLKKWWEVSHTPKESLVSFPWQWGWL